MIDPQKQFPRLTVAALATAVTGNLVAASFPVYSLIHVPSGSSVRLMSSAMYSGITSLLTLVVVSILVIVSLRREGYLVLAWVAFLLSFTPFPFSGLIMNRVAATRGIELAD
jgi:hypothetical protein